MSTRTASACCTARTAGISEPFIIVLEAVMAREVAVREEGGIYLGKAVIERKKGEGVKLLGWGGVSNRRFREE